MNEHPQPLGGNVMPRFGGPATMMRLPGDTPRAVLDVGFVGVPFDIGTSNRPGARFGPRQIRAESCLLRPYQMATGAAPFDDLMVDDIGDVPINTFNLAASIELIRGFYSELPDRLRPISLGGDHTITYPILSALKQRHGTLGVVHVDAHADVNRSMFGEPVTHGTWLRNAIEEDVVDPRRVVQIGVRGSGYSASDFEWLSGLGGRVVQVEECWHRSLTPLMSEARAQLGDAPVYLTFDVDGLDPAFAPGTGTPEIAGLTPVQGVEIIRGCRGLNLVGSDVVEVAPPYDVSGNTSLLAANLAFEQLCVMPGVHAPRRHGHSPDPTRP
jgi:guanidinobutyrase